MHDTIGPFRITGEIGRGGMGVVYLARDERLDRDVAIKALPEELAGDAGRLERFEREARTLASLNHPNIGAIYGVEEQDGKKYLVLEYVDGETLADRLDRGTLRIDEAIEVAVEIARGVEAAHEAGVVHRDLKPANIKLTPEGKVKVLDFGLAKTDEGLSSTGSGLSQSPTMTSPVPQHSPTIPGAILGTAAYMSPEQARGRKVDKRTDIWAFGVILYEMLTGASPFVGETATDSIGAVLHKSVDPERLPAGTTPGVRRVISRCVARDRELRYRDIGDVRIELSAPAVEAVAGSGPGPAKGWGIRRWAAAGVVLIAGVGAGWLGAGWIRRGESPAVGRFDVFTESEGARLDKAWPRVSPDGRSVAFIQNGVVHVRDLGSFTSRALTDTDGALGVFWSPDSSWVGYFSHSAMFKAPRSGGGAIKLADGMSLGLVSGGWWNDRDQIVFSSGQSGIAALSAKGGSPQTVIPTPERGLIDFHDPVGVPGSGVLLYVEHRDDMSFALVAADGDRKVELASEKDRTLATPAYSPSGHVLYARGPDEWSIWALAFDVDAMEVRGARSWCRATRCARRCRRTARWCVSVARSSPATDWRG